MAIEFLLNETVESVWLNYVIPSLVGKEVRAATLVLKKAAETLTSDGALPAGRVKFFLDATPNLFASTKVAQQHPTMLESVVVLSYHSHLPGELSRTWPHYRKALGVCEVSEPQKLAKARWLSWMRSMLLRIMFGMSTAIVLSLKWLGTFSFGYRRVIIRFL